MADHNFVLVPLGDRSSAWVISEGRMSIALVEVFDNLLVSVVRILVPLVTLVADNLGSSLAVGIRVSWEHSTLEETV